MRFQRKKAHRQPYYGPTTKATLQEQMYAECAKALANGHDTDRITTTYNISKNPISSRRV